MAMVTICSNHPSTTPCPPIVPKTHSHTKPLQRHHHHHLRISGKQDLAISRRHLPLLLIVLPSLRLPPPAIAFDFGISGPKDWLKEQKKKSIKYILAPIDASVDLLQSAHQLLLAKDSDDKRNVWEQIQGLLRSASRDCVPEERNSFVAFQAKTGVEVCTFKLVVKNASSLLDDNDPTKVKAEGMLGDLIRSFTVLNGVAKEANYQLVSDSVRSVIYILQCQFVTTTAERPISTSPDAFSSLANFLVGSLGISEKQALSTSTKRTTFQQSRGATKKEDCRCFDGYNSFPSQV